MNHKDTADLFWKVIMGILGYSLDLTPPPVRQAWQTYGEPDFKITDNVIFLQLMYESGNDVARPLYAFNEDWGSGSKDIKETKTQTRVLRLRLIAYGSNGAENLYKIRTALYGGITELRSKGIYCIPSDDEPRYAPELFAGQWWERTEFDFLFNQYAEYVNKIGTIESVPVEVKLNGESGTTTDSFVVEKDE